VFDCLGREIGVVLDKNLVAGNHTADIDIANLKHGVYFLYIKHNAENTVVRFEAVAK
jgi:Secretion system C-terminal sorting domain